MPLYHRYAEDPTGQNPDNLIQGELYSLSDRPIRVAVPIYGPFFVNSLVVYDNLTMQPLVKTTVNAPGQYRVPTISQELSLRYGQEIADAILIEDTTVASQIRLRYQALGGLAQNRTQMIADVYENWLNDNRSVDWTTGIYGKPAQFPTGPHPHWLSEIYGWEPVTFELERIAQAIQIGNTPAFELLIETMKGREASEEDIDIADPLDKVITLRRLLYAAQHLNFNTIWIKPEATTIVNGQSLWFDVKASNAPDTTSYIWTIEHEGTDDSDFVGLSGLVNLSYGSGRFMIQTAMTSAREENEVFRIALRKHSASGTIIARSTPLTLAGHASWRNDGLLEALRISCFNSPRLAKTAKVHAVNRKLWTSTFR